MHGACGGAFDAATILQLLIALLLIILAVILAVKGLRTIFGRPQGRIGDVGWRLGECGREGESS